MGWPSPTMEEARLVAQLCQVGPHIDLVDVLECVKVPLHFGYRHHPLVRVLQVLARLLRRYGPGLQQEDARDDLEAVGDAVLHFPQQDILLPQQFFGLLQKLFLLPFDRRAGGDIREGEKDRPVRTVFVDNLSGVQDHGSAAEIGKIMLDLEIVHRDLLGDDGFQQDPQGRDVPLAVSQRVQQAPLGLFGVDLERSVERDAGRQHAKLGIEHDEWLGMVLTMACASVCASSIF